MTQDFIELSAAYGWQPGQSLRLAMLSNPGSGRNREGQAAIQRILSRQPKLVHAQGRNPTEIANALQSLSQSDPDVLIINAGDGTVAATLTALFNQRPFARQPVLALLAGGTTNMTAGDVGMPGKSTRALERLLRWAQAIHSEVQLLQRPILRVQAGVDQESRYGMFFGSGAIIKGIEYCHNKVLRRGMRDSFGPGLCIFRVLFAMLRGDQRYAAPVAMRVKTEPPYSTNEQAVDHFFLLASTLERLFLGIHPYWGERQGKLYFSAVRAHAARPLLTYPSLLRGKANRHANPENGYWSRKVNELELTMDSTFTIDGELYPCDSRQGPVHVSADETATFLRF